MTRNEWEELLQGFGGSAVQGEVDGLLRALLEAVGAEAQIPGRVSVAGAASERASEIDGLLRALQGGVEPTAEFPARVSSVGAPPVVRTASPEDDGGSTAATVLRTIGMVTGVGPAITGLLKLFGSGGGSTSEPLYAPVPYSLPEQVSVEAGLARDRSFVDIGYAAQGGPRALPAAASSGRAPRIQIHVNAMDSRSFSDHSEEIARAVREAMLRSHTLNDVIAEI